MAAEIKKEIELEIAHVLFLDIVGYSKLSVNEQHARVDELNQIVRASEQFQKAEAANRILKIPTGDGMALVFYKSPEEPAQCAFEISRALKDNQRLQVRMGIHSGPVSGMVDVNERTNVAGAGINLAQRVMDCGDAGHILLSQHVAEDLAEYERWRPFLHDIGAFEVKHSARVSVTNLYSDEVGNPNLPSKLQAVKKHHAHVRWAAVAIGLLVVAALAAALFSFLRKGPARSLAAAVEKSIAVLPFENLSDEKANAYFADGIQDEILTRLAKISDLKVISRTSTQHYKSTPQNVREIAKQLGVAHIVEGSVQKSGDAVRVNVQLIKAENDAHLWADTFDRKLTDIFSVESDIAKSIADQLQAKLTGAEQQIISAKPTNSVEAYDAYLRGLAYTLRASNNPAAALGAQKYFREAARLDPKFALGWAQLSIVDSRNYLTQSLQPTVALREEARLATETALNLQPELGEAILARGSYYYYCLKDYDAAVRYFEQARQLLPNSSRIPESLAYIARKQGQWDRSEAYFAEAQRLDPRNVNLLIQHAINDICHRRFRKALRKLDEALNITPDDSNIVVAKAGIAQAEGDLPRASALLAQLHFTAEDIEGPETQAYQAILEGRPASAIPLLKNVLSKPDPALGYFNAVLRFWLGWAQEAAGDKVDAQQTWQQAREELETFLKEQPDNYLLMGNLALVDLGLGDKTVALDLSARAMAVNPVEKDAVTGLIPLEVLARVAARTGDSDRAIATLEKLLSTPYNGALAAGMPLTPALLRLDPMFDPLRHDPRFQKLLAASAAQ
jgi:TolB-like protein/class 3 adenylate cyclase/Tfp pilus assembly protein PilF